VPLGHSLSGLLNIAKPVGITSFACVARVKQATGVDSIGHGGTLDPQADGVLPVLLGRATRLAPFVHEWPKTYQAVIQLGAVSATYDSEGPITPAGEPRAVPTLAIEAVLPEFTGHILQVPPMHSALKRGGEPLYRKARRGETVERLPRAVEVIALRLLEHDRPGGRLCLEVICGKGMYVRSLAHDLGARLGPGAYLRKLSRIAFGPLPLAGAVPLDTLAAAGASWTRWLLPLDLPLRDWPAITLEGKRAQAVVHGRAVAAPEAGTPGRYRTLDAHGQLLAWGTVDLARVFQPRAVFRP